jgi:hypothetical protein
MISGEHYSRHIWREIQSVILALIDSKDGLNTTIFHSGLLHRGVLLSYKGRRKCNITMGSSFIRKLLVDQLTKDQCQC